jgi:glycosyltransferase involved in cell wall biosynthesis
MLPIVSVVMSVLNEEYHLQDAVSSILRQTLDNIEIIIVDDGSIDATPEILNGLLANDYRVKIIRHENPRGLPASLNEAITSSISPWIARLDGDDTAKLQRLQTQLKFLEEHPEVGLLGSFSRVIAKSGAEIGVLHTPVSDAEIRRTMRRRNAFVHSSVMFRRDLFDAVGGYNEAFKYSQDYELWGRMSRLCAMHNIPEALIDSRWNSSRMRRKSLQAGFYSIRSQRRYLKSLGFGVKDYISIAASLFSLLIPLDIRMKTYNRLFFK